MPCSNMLRPLLAGHVRSTDTVARLGGDLFIVLMPQTPPKAPWPWPKVASGPSRPTLTGKASALVYGERGGEQRPPWRSTPVSRPLYGAADRALYAAKNQGRDRVVLAASADPAGPAASAA